MSGDDAASEKKREIDAVDEPFTQTKRQLKKQKKSHAAALTNNKPNMSFDLNNINKRNNRYGIHVSLLYSYRIPLLYTQRTYETSFSTSLLMARRRTG